MRMRIGLIVVVVLGLTAGVTSTAPGASSCLRSADCEGQLEVGLHGAVHPNGLPITEFKPVTLGFSGSVKISGGGHPSALRELVADVDKDVALDLEGLPRCGLAQIEASTTGAARQACGKARVGGGAAHFDIAAPEPSPVVLEGRLTAFNAGEANGMPRILIHAYLPPPVDDAAIARMTIQRKGTGLHTITTIPPIADGRASIVDFDLRLGRTYAYEGEERGYLSARCPDGVFKVNTPKVLFRNETQVPGVAATTILKGGFAVPCTPKG